MDSAIGHAVLIDSAGSLQLPPGLGSVSPNLCASDRCSSRIIPYSSTKVRVLQLLFLAPFSLTDSCFRFSSESVVGRLQIVKCSCVYASMGVCVNACLQNSMCNKETVK